MAWALTCFAHDNHFLLIAIFQYCYVLLVFIRTLFDWLSRNISNSMRWPHTWLTNNVTWYRLGRYCGWNMGANNKVTIEKKMMSKPYCTRKTFHRFLSNNSCRIRLVSYVRAVTKFCRCQVCVITGWRTKQLGGSFGSLFLFFHMKVCRDYASSSRGKISGCWL